MEILNNPILGKNFKLSSLKLTPKGLFRRIQVGQLIKEIFLTKDEVKICELMGIDYDFIYDREGDECWPHLITSPYFSPLIFIELEKKGNYKSKEIMALHEWLTDENQNLNKKAMIKKHMANQPIRTERVEEILGLELRDDIQNTKRVLGEFPTARKKFHSMKEIVEAKGYNPQNYQGDIPKFFSQFKPHFKCKEYYVDTTVEQMAADFLECVND